MYFLAKVCLLLFIFISSTAIGFLLANHYSKRVSELEDFLLSLELFETKITYTYDDLIDTFSYIANQLKTKIYRIYFIVAEKLREAPNQSVGELFKEVVDEEKIFLELQDSDIENIKGLAISLGQIDVESQIKNIRLIAKTIENTLKDAYEEKKKSFKLYRNMGTLVGLVLMILLI